MMTRLPTPLPRETRRKRRGAAAVEFGMWLPILLSMIGGIVDFGVYLGHLQIVSRAARDSSRTAASVVSSPNATLEEIEDTVTPVVETVVEAIFTRSGRTCSSCVDVQVTELESIPGSTLRVVDVRVTSPDITYYFNIVPLPNTSIGRFVVSLDRQLVDPEEVE